MDENIEKQIISQYEKGIPLHEIKCEIKLRTSEVYKIVRKYKNGEIIPSQIIFLFEAKTPMFQIAKQLNVPYDDIMKIINPYRKKTKQYNTGQFGKVAEKNKMDKEFVKYIQPKSILDAFAGDGKIYNKSITVTNDISKKCDTTFHETASELLLQYRESYKKFDLVDLDPYGSCHDCWDDAISIAQKGIIISYGDLMVWRYHYKDDKYWSPKLGNGRKPTTIHDLKHSLIQRAIEIGWHRSKSLHVWNIFQNFQWMRVYYEIK